MSASRVGWHGVQGREAGVYRHAFSFAVGLEGTLPVCEGGVVEVDGRRLPLPLLGQRAGGWTWALCWGPPRDMVETQGPANVVCVCETKPRDSRGPLCRWWREQGLPDRQVLEPRLSSSAPCSSVPPPPRTCWSATNPRAVGRRGSSVNVHGLPERAPGDSAGGAAPLLSQGHSRSPGGQGVVTRACMHVLAHTHARAH